MSESAHDQALAHASRAAVRTLTRASTFRRLVTGYEVRREHYWRVAYQVERRRVVPRFAAAHGVRKHELRPLPQPGSVDPWGVEPVTLPAYSRTASMCPGCQGETKVACATCRGTARVGCGQCGGSGRVAGQRGMKNCPGCRGQGAARCPSCSKGRVSCPMCAATGMVTAWLEISTERLLQVHAHPRDGIAALHSDLMSPDDIDAPAASFRSARVQDSGWIAASAPPVSELSCALGPVADRIVAQRTQRFESEVHEFRYGLRSATGVVKVAGSPAGVLPSSDWAPLQLRLAVAAGTAVLGLVLAMFIRGRYLAQAPWFTQHGNALALLVLAGTAACAAASLVSGLWLPSRARSQVRTLLPAGVVAVSSSLALALWFVGGPTVAGVDASLERGDLVEARIEAEALTRLGRDPDGLDVALVRLDELEAEELRIREAQEDDEHFARVQDAPSLQAAVDELGRGWHTDRRTADARAVAVVRAGQLLDASLGTDDEASFDHGSCSRAC